MPHEHPPPPPPPGSDSQDKLDYAKIVVTGPYSDKEKAKALEEAYSG
jgi:hypothetical protein